MPREDYAYHDWETLYIVKHLPEDEGELIFIRTKSEKDTYDLEAIAEINGRLVSLFNLPLGWVIFENRDKKEWKRYKIWIKNLSAKDSRDLIWETSSILEWNSYDSIYPSDY